jgi:hypothetical protein
MERQRNEPLFDTVNAEMAKALEDWHESPFSPVCAGKINTLIHLAQSAGYGITLEVNLKSWEDKNAAEILPDLRYRTEGDVAKVDIDHMHLYIHAYNPAPPYDGFITPVSNFVIENGNKQAAFSPEDVLNIQILEERTFGTLKEVKDAYWPNVPDEEFLQMMDSGEFPESLKRIVEKTKKANEPESEPE